jgi:type II secretory pathway component PulM
MTTQQAIINREKKYLIFGCGALLFLFIAYMYVVSSTVLQVVAREQIADQIVALESDIGQLEASYMMAQHEISKDIAFQSGFIPADNKFFITDTNTAVALNN